MTGYTRAREGATVRAYHTEDGSLCDEGVTGPNGTVRLVLWEEKTNAARAQGIDEKTREMMSTFLKDQKTIEGLNYEDLTIRYEKALRDRSLKDKR